MQHSPTTDPAGMSSLHTTTEIKVTIKVQSKDIISKAKEEGNFVRKCELLRGRE